MRTADLVARVVEAPDGSRLGAVVDVRVVGNGPSRGGALPGLRVDGLVVSPRRFGALWGYDRYEQHGPWLLRALVRWWHRDVRYARWDTVGWQPSGPLRLAADPAPLPPLRE